MKNYNVSDEPVTEVAVDINDIKDTCNEKGRNAYMYCHYFGICIQCVFAN